MVNIAQRIRKGDIQAAAKILTMIEHGDPSAIPILKALTPYTGRAHVIGITGPVGTGKSSLINSLTNVFRRRKKKVGILAVDPTSPVSGGAILGDRIRMRDHFTDPGVFIRSLAARGAPGGFPTLVLAQALHVLDALGMDVIFIETIGIGQDQSVVDTLARTTVVVINPSMGDEVQLLKAGFMESGDLFAINKSDLPGADSMAVLLTDVSGSDRHIPIVRTSVTKRQGIEELIKALDEKWEDTRSIERAPRKGHKR